jgi:CHASE3 domain sensor protein
MQEEPAFITIPLQTLKDLLQEVQGMREQINALEARQDEDNERLGREIALDRQRLTKLEKVKLQPLQRDQSKTLMAIIAANGGKMLAKDARQQMRMDKGNFSRLLDTLKDDIDTKPLHQDKRRLLLIIK